MKKQRLSKRWSEHHLAVPSLLCTQFTTLRRPQTTTAPPAKARRVLQPPRILLNINVNLVAVHNVNLTISSLYTIFFPSGACECQTAAAFCLLQQPFRPLCNHSHIQYSLCILRVGINRPYVVLQTHRMSPWPQAL